MIWYSCLLYELFKSSVKRKYLWKTKLSALERLKMELLKRVKQKTAIELGMDKKIIKD